jgi:DNA-binding GntR family transcriptional regulator
MLAELDAALAAVDAAVEVAEFEERAREFRRVLNTAVAGSRLRALLRSFGGLVPVASRLSIPGTLEEERRLVRAEHAAIHRGDGDAAAAAAAEHMRLLGELAVRTLRERGVLGADDTTDTTDDIATERPGR